MWQTALAGFSLGLVASLHCIGMCGPLALALPVYHLGRRRQVMAVLLYNTGRVITYSVLGALLGWAGRGISIAGFQQVFSIGLGALILLFLCWNLRIGSAMQPAWLQTFYGRVQQLAARTLQPKTMVAYLLPGLINGLLPCGMVYLAIAGAVSMRQPLHGAGWMFFFGIGTIPAMFILGIFGVRIGLPVRRQFKKAMPWLAAGMAVVLILRGLNIGIPFISPSLSGSGDTISCHHE